MSRYNTTATIEGQTRKAVYGYDYATGYFVQVYNATGHKLVVDESTAATSLNGGRMLEIIEQYGIAVNDAHLTTIAFDMPV